MEARIAGGQTDSSARMSPSTPFILRPVATSLLMAGILLVGGVAFKQLPVSALPQVDYPTIQVVTFYPGRQPRRDGVLRHRAARAAVRPGARPEPDDLHQFPGRLGHHPAVRPRSEHRCRRAAGAGRHQRRQHLPAARPSEPADLQQDQSRRRADPHPGADLENPAALQGRRPGRYAPGAEDLAVAGRRAGQHQRRPEAGGPRAGQPDRALRLRPEPGRPARGHRHGQRQPGEGQLRRRRSSPTPSAPTTSCSRQRRITGR